MLNDCPRTDPPCQTARARRISSATATPPASQIADTFLPRICITALLRQTLLILKASCEKEKRSRSEVADQADPDIAAGRADKFPGQEVVDPVRDRALEHLGGQGPSPTDADVTAELYRRPQARLQRRRRVGGSNERGGRHLEAHAQVRSQREWRGHDSDLHEWFNGRDDHSAQVHDDGGAGRPRADIERSE